MPIWKSYLIPKSLHEAVRALDDAPGSVRLIAGGTDLLLDLQQGRHQPVDLLVDVNRIPELRVCEIRQNEIFIGAAVPLNKVTTSPLVMEHAMALHEASGLVGGPQVRNSATLGGNVAHALPAADGTIALMALNAQVEIANSQGLIRKPLGELFQGPGKSTLDLHHDILVGFYLPLKKPGEASAFSRIMRPQGVALPILNMAAWISRSGDLIADVHLSVGPAGPTPQRGFAAEEALRGKPLTDETIQEALSGLLASLRFRTSPQRATAEYRRHLCGVLIERVLKTAWTRTFNVQMN